MTSAMAGVFDAKGRLVAQWTPESQELAGRPVMAGMAVAPGSYRLRVAAVDSSGRSGTVDTELRLELGATGAVSTSGVVLGAQTPGGFVPRLQFGPSDSSAGVYLEIYGASSCPTVTAALELAPSGQTPALVKSAATAGAVDQSDACSVFAELAVGALPPGDYVLRIALWRSGQVVERRASTLRKSVR